MRRTSTTSPVGVHNVTGANAKELMRAGVEGWLHVPVRGGETVDAELVGDREGPDRQQQPPQYVDDAGPHHGLDEYAGRLPAGVAR